MPGLRGNLADFGSDGEDDQLFIEATWAAATRSKDDQKQIVKGKSLVTLTPFGHERTLRPATNDVNVRAVSRRYSVDSVGPAVNKKASTTRTLTAPSRAGAGPGLNLVSTLDVNKWAQGLEKYERWEQVLASQEQERAVEDRSEVRIGKGMQGKDQGSYVDFYHADSLLLGEGARRVSLSTHEVVQRTHDRATRPAQLQERQHSKALENARAMGHRERGHAVEPRGRTAPTDGDDEDIAQQRLLRMQQRRVEQVQQKQQPRLSKTLGVFDRHARDHRSPIKKIDRRIKSSYSSYHPVDFRNSAAFFTEGWLLNTHARKHMTSLTNIHAQTHRESCDASYPRRSKAAGHAPVKIDGRSERGSR
jgi:hypothetical protein